MSDKSQMALVVDDEEIIRYVLSEDLEEIGYECVQASSGQSALEQLASQRFQVVMLDIRMPGVNGLEVLKTIRASYPDTCVIMISALANPDVADRAVRSMGADAFVSKPWHNEELQMIIGRAVQQRAAAAGEPKRANVRGASNR